MDVNWDKEAPKYQQVFKTAGKSEYNIRLMKFFCDELGLHTGSRVIDIGCGVGKYGTYFAEMGCDVTLTDISGEMLRHAQENMRSFNSPCTFLQCDFNVISQENEIFQPSFDLSISTMSPAIHDIETIQKMSAITNGFCFISRFTDWSQPIRDEFYRLSGMKPAHSMNSEKLRKDVEDFTALVKEAGFSPDVQIVDYNWEDLRTPQEAAARFAGCDSGEDFDRSLNTVLKLCNENGKFADAVNTKVAWIYWKAD